jgi:hypothetical protein
VAGHPATLDGERELLWEAARLLEEVLAADPEDHAARRLLLQVRLADDAERYRTLYGYGGTPGVENLGRSNALVEQFRPEPPLLPEGSDPLAAQSEGARSAQVHGLLGTGAAAGCPVGGREPLRSPVRHP